MTSFSLKNDNPNAFHNDSHNQAKTVFLIRHAESEENRRLGSLKTAWTDMFHRAKIPQSHDVTAAWEWITMAPVQYDTTVSAVGRQQIAIMGQRLQYDDFLHRQTITLVAHSPLQRARDTAQGMLGCSCRPDIVHHAPVANGGSHWGDVTSTSSTTITASSLSTTSTATTTTTWSINKTEPVKRVVQLDLLSEKSITEWTMQGAQFQQRLRALENWIADQPEQAIALVGHSQFFKALLRLPFKFGNCDVWQIQFDAAGSNPKEYTDQLPPKWTQLRKIYSCSDIMKEDLSASALPYTAVAQQNGAGPSASSGMNTSPPPSSSS